MVTTTVRLTTIRFQYITILQVVGGDGMQEETVLLSLIPQNSTGSQDKQPQRRAMDGDKYYRGL